MKHLQVRNNADALFLHHYPTLEHLQYLPLGGMQIDELKTFFEKHSKLKQFETHYEFLWVNRDVFYQMTTQLDLLNVCLDAVDNTVPSHELLELFKTLYERGFYKTLQLSLYHDVEIENIQHLRATIATLPALEKLSIRRHSLIDLSRITHLKELRLEALVSDMRTDAENLAKNLSNLKRLTIYLAHIDAVTPFIRYSKKLQTITIIQILDSHLNLNLNALNEEREKLPNACKISLYVIESVYSAAKWKWGNLNSNLIEILRADSFFYP